MNGSRNTEAELTSREAHSWDSSELGTLVTRLWKERNYNEEDFPESGKPRAL